MTATYQDIAPRVMAILREQLRSAKHAHDIQKVRACEHAMEGQEKGFSIAKLSAMTSLTLCKSLSEPIEWLCDAKPIALPEIVQVDKSNSGDEIWVDARVPSLAEERRPYMMQYLVDPCVIDYNVEDICIGDASAQSTYYPAWQTAIHAYAIQVQVKTRFKLKPFADFRSKLRECVRKRRRVDLDGELGHINKCFKNKDGYFEIHMEDCPVHRSLPLKCAVETESRNWWVKTDKLGWRLMLIPMK